MFKKGKWTIDKEIFKALPFTTKFYVLYAVLMINLGLPVWFPEEKKFYNVDEFQVF